MVYDVEMKTVYEHGEKGFKIKYLTVQGTSYLVSHL